MSFRFRPLADLHVTSPYGERDLDGDGTNESHLGTDYRAAVGTPLFAMGAGIVERAVDVDNSANGKHVVIVDDDDGRLVYLHMSRVDVVGGQRVEAGQLIGLSGKTGAARGPHLHLQWQPNFPPSTATADIAPVASALPPPPNVDAGGGGGLGVLLAWGFAGWGLVKVLSKRGRK